MENSPILEVRSVSKNFAVANRRTLRAVNRVSLALYPGETLGLVGESGCGKTTLGRLLVRLYQPDEGDILFEGKDVRHLDRKGQLNYHKQVQMIFQDPYASLDPLKVVSESIAEGLEIHNLCPPKERHERVVELLNMVGLNREHANRFPHEFSGGQRQRIGIARALAVEPRVIVCDEPISALDVSIQAQVVNLLIRLQREQGLSYLFITHDLSMVKQISDRIAVMYLGNLMEIAPKNKLYTRHMHPYTHVLLSAIPIPDPEEERRRQRVLLSGDVPSPMDVGPGCCFCRRCPYAQERCRTERPELEKVDSGHFVACHYKKTFL